MAAWVSAVLVQGQEGYPMCILHVSGKVRNRQDANMRNHKPKNRSCQNAVVRAAGAFSAGCGAGRRRERLRISLLFRDGRLRAHTQSRERESRAREPTGKPSERVAREPSERAEREPSERAEREPSERAESEPTASRAKELRESRERAERELIGAERESPSKGPERAERER